MPITHNIKSPVTLAAADITEAEIANGAVTDNKVNFSFPTTNKNFIINGAMNLCQRTANSGSTSANGYHLADRFETTGLGHGSQTHGIVTDVPSGYGFNRSYRLYRDGANDSLAPNPGTTNILTLSQKIEGQNLQHLCKGTSNAKELTLSYWSKFSTADLTYTVELVDLDNTRQISKTATTTSDWTKTTITFPADTTGTLDNDSNASLQINWWLNAGSNYDSGTLNDSAWASTTDANRVSSSNLRFNCTNTDNGSPTSFNFTGVQLEVGPNATAFEYEPFETTFRKCRRYYARWDRTGPPAEPYVQAVYVGHGQMFSTTQGVIYPTMYEPMRGVPDIGYSAVDDFGFNMTGATNKTTTALSIYDDASHSDETMSYNPVIIVTVSSTTNGKYGRFFISDATNGYLELDAEL